MLSTMPLELCFLCYSRGMGNDRGEYGSTAFAPQNHLPDSNALHREKHDSPTCESPRCTYTGTDGLILRAFPEKGYKEPAGICQFVFCNILENIGIWAVYRNQLHELFHLTGLDRREMNVYPALDIQV